MLDMGEPVKIYDLAVSLIKLSGLEPNTDIPIKITGLRPGEKLYEELLMNEEGLKTTKHEKIFVGKPSRITSKELETKINRLQKLVEMPNVGMEQIKETMKQIVPTYVEPEEHMKEQIKKEKQNAKLKTVVNKVSKIYKENKQVEANSKTAVNT